jgi:hypothetical protein
VTSTTSSRGERRSLGGGAATTGRRPVDGGMLTRHIRCLIARCTGRREAAAARSPLHSDAREPALLYN